MYWLNVIYWILSFIGHIGLWCMLYNHTHATSWPRIVRKRCEKFIIVAIVVIFLWYCIWFLRHRTIDFWERELKSFVEYTYLFVTMAMGIFLTIRWAYRKTKSNPACVLDRKQTLTDVQAEIGRSVYLTPVAQKLGMLPFNQAHKLAIEKIQLGIERLPLPLEDFRICHLSDFHLTGQMDLEWFEHVVAKANGFEPDLILITGDLIDEAKCLDWIEPVFGQLKAKHGIYFVRGNHDLRIMDQQELLQRLENSGMCWIGGKWERLEIEGVGIYLAGNELPWFAGAEDLSQKPHQVHGESGMEDLPCLKILLSHTPDQISWAKDYDFDLILAGHNHGGQIALPFIGPIVAPSRHGVLYASGTFEIDDAVMHVSRGLSGDECIRINCPPEVGLFTLKRI